MARKNSPTRTKRNHPVRNGLALIDRIGKIKVGYSEGYTPAACDHVIALMQRGYSLTGVAGAMGVSRSTIAKWMKLHEEFPDAVEVGKARRVWALETALLDSDNPAIIKARRFALVNAAPAEWREKQALEQVVPPDNPIRLLAQQLMGTALRPKPQTGHPEQVKATDTVKEPTALEAEPQEDEDDAPRIHTVSRQSYEDSGDQEL